MSWWRWQKLLWVRCIKYIFKPEKLWKLVYLKMLLRFTMMWRSLKKTLWNSNYEHHLQVLIKIKVTKLNICVKQSKKVYKLDELEKLVSLKIILHSTMMWELPEKEEIDKNCFGGEVNQFLKLVYLKMLLHSTMIWEDFLCNFNC